jgi:hypothetical protein
MGYIASDEVEKAMKIIGERGSAGPENLLETAEQLLPQPIVQCDTTLREPFAFLPDGRGRWKVESLGSYAQPRRKEHVRVYDVESFLSYFNRFQTDTTQVFYAEKPNTITATFDYFRPASAEYSEKEHNLTLDVRYSDDYSFWQGQTNKWISQLDFAEILDERHDDLVDGLTLKEVALTLEQEATSTFRNARRLKDDKKDIRWSVDVQTKAGVNGELEVPETIIVRVPMFLGSPAMSFPARLRISVKEGAAHFKILPNRWKKMEEAAMLGVIQQIEEKTKLTVYKCEEYKV